MAIVGVGLIGGSIGLAARRADWAAEIVGVGRRQASLRKAKARGAVDRTTTDLARGVRGAEMVIVCTPVGSIFDAVKQVAAACPTGALISDAGSTKAEVVARLDGWLAKRPRGAKDVHFVGGHPLAGDERTGPEYARADLFDQKTVVLTPTAHSRQQDVRTLRRFWTAMGAKVKILSPDEHDRMVAASSHLPHLVASALAAATPQATLPLCASGWLDTTRVAAGDAELWEQIMHSNRHHLLRSLDSLEKKIALFRTALKRGDRRRLEELLAEGKQRRDAVGS